MSHANAPVPVLRTGTGRGVFKTATGNRRADHDMGDALRDLRQRGVVPWHWITDETRTLHRFRTATSVAAYVADAARNASLDRWGGQPAPLILCESRSLEGTLHGLAAMTRVRSTNGQCSGFLITEVAPTLRDGPASGYAGWYRL